MGCSRTSAFIDKIKIPGSCEPGVVHPVLRKHQKIHGHRIQEAQADAHCHLQRGMSHEFLQLDGGKLVLDLELFHNVHQLVDEDGLLAGLLSDAHGIVADDDGEDGGHGELMASRSVHQGAEYRQAGDRGAVAAGHAAVAEEPLKAQPAVHHRIEDRLDDLRQKPGRQCRNQIGIPHKLPKPFHKNHIPFVFLYSSTDSGVCTVKKVYSCFYQLNCIIFVQAHNFPWEPRMV